MVVITLLCAIAILPLILSRVERDEQKRLESGTTRVFLGVILGDLSLIRQGMEEGGDLRSPLDPFIAEKVIKLGEPFVDYPLCPPVHLAFNYGLKEHLAVASFLVSQNADVNDYMLPAIPLDHFQRGYPPAILYAMGFGQKANNSHAAFLQRFHRTFRNKIDFSRLEEWRRLSNNPPLLHLSIALDNFDATYVLLSEFSHIASLNTIDQFGMTALHYAVWKASLQATVFLLYNAIDCLIQDVKGQSALHVAIARRDTAQLALLLGHILNRRSSQPLRVVKDDFKTFLQLQNAQGRTALDLLLLAPFDRPSLELLSHFAREIDLSLQELVFPAVRSSLQHLLSLPISLHCRVREEVEITEGWLEKENFLRDFFIPQRPVLVGEGCASGMAIWAHSESIEAFIARFGHLSLATGELTRDFISENFQYWSSLSPSSSCSTEMLNSLDNGESTPVLDLLDFVEEVQKSKLQPAVLFISHRLYTEQFHLDFHLPVVFDVCGNNELADYSLTMLPTGSCSSLQSTPASVHLLLKGRVLWLLFRPGLTSNHSLLQDIEHMLGVNRTHWSNFSGRQWIGRALLPLRRHHLVHFAEQQQGEAFFLPHDWQFLIWAEEDSILLSRNICSHAITDARIPPLGYLIYGGYDPLRNLGHPRIHNPSSNRVPGMNYRRRKKVPMFDYPFVT
eukprot:gene9332-10299_t